jgi:two-component system cell cycle response regulator
MYPMPARILILDAIANNRIVLKVKMQSAQFDVDACANRADAERALAQNRPDLILVNFADSAQDHHAFCKKLRSSPDTASIALIATGISDTAMARFAALDAGADDVLPRPINDTLLLGRIRSLLRVRSVGQELFLRESTSRALGFEDARKHFEVPAKIAFVTATPDDHTPMIDALSQDLRCPVTPIGMDAALGAETPATAPDLLIIYASAIPENERSFSVFFLICVPELEPVWQHS